MLVMYPMLDIHSDFKIVSMACQERSATVAFIHAHLLSVSASE